MNVFIIYAHPESASFNGAMKDTAVGVLSDAGHEVRVSDLVAMDFTAVTDARDFPRPADPERLDIPAEQRAAFKNGSTSPDIHFLMPKRVSNRSALITPTNKIAAKLHTRILAIESVIRKPRYPVNRSLGLSLLVP